MVTVTQLGRWQPERLDAAASALAGAAAQVTETHRALAATGGTRLSEDEWRGLGGDAARREMARHRGELAELGEQLAAAGRVLTVAAVAIRGAKAGLTRAQALAAEHRVTLADDGTAIPPPVSLSGLLRQSEPGALAALEAAGAAVAERCAALARTALEAADEADRDAARALRAALSARGLRRGTLLSLLGMLTGAPLRAMLGTGLLAGVLLRDLPPAGATPLEVAAWWASLSPEQRQLQVRANPDAVGQLDGLPAAARHAANLLVLHRELAAARAEEQALLAAGIGTDSRDRWLHPDEVARLGATRQRIAIMERVQEQLAADPGNRTLLLLDLEGQGRAAIGIGPVDTAEHLALVIPGWRQDVAGDLQRTIHNADRLERAARGLSDRLGGGSVATVAWLGYDTPDGVEVASDAHAQRGAPLLRSALEGLEASRDAVPGARPPHLTVVGHSYGSLTAGIALREPTPTDELVIIGSPGVGAMYASELEVPGGHVFVNTAYKDEVLPVVRARPFGADPSQVEFGAREFQTDGGVDPVTGERLAPSVGHSRYFESRSESVRNISLVALGAHDLVTYGDFEHDRDQELRELAEDTVEEWLR